jgi:hypothetical protein
MAAIAAGAGCLALSACGSSSSAASAAGVTASAAGAPSSASTADPLASLSAAKIEAEATVNTEAAATLTINGTVTQSGQTQTFDLGIKRGVGCAGTIGEGSKGSFKLILVGSTVYINPDRKFWTASAGSNASAAIALVNGRYLKTTTSDKNMTGIGDLCDVHKLLTSGGITAEAKEAVTTLGGIRVLPLKVSDGSTEYVTDTSSPQFVEATSPKGSANGSSKVTIAFNTPVTVAAPPASQVIDGSQLGF